MKSDQTYPKTEKLKSRKLIDKLFSEGRSVSKFPLRLVYLQTELPEDTIVQVAVSVSKRNFKKAVDRNRIKRLIREAYRLNKDKIKPHLETPHAFMFLYTSKEITDFHTLEKSMKKLLKKFREEAL
ncbi:ribonuclease P protein component [Robertkochia solimangrovi]|uniref:ribonuclease P protein component n=1 Tax=Robertkochia solimangrovi TaxID=2213046 RepID=UPI00117C3C30|nr:ribonuclease P protein component [Robertkochia solimangrovi]TRZ46075.1 ribonuclease P protein component [Robertkochia solimangrovi]